MLSVLLLVGFEAQKCYSNHPNDSYIRPSIHLLLYRIINLTPLLKHLCFQWGNAAPILSIQWGVSNFYREEESADSPRTRARIPHFLHLPNIMISLLGFAVAALSTLVLFIVTEIILRIQLNNLDFGESFLDDWKTSIISLICSLFYSILNAVSGSYIIPWFSNLLTRWEKHKFQSYFNNSLIFKHTGYYLISSYLHLMYLVLGMNT